MPEHLNNLLRRKADVQRPPDVAPQRPFPPQRRQAGQRADAPAGQIQPRTRPGRPPVVFPGDAPQLPFRSGGRRRPARARRPHILPPQLLAPPEQLIRALAGVVYPGRRKVNPPFRKHLPAHAQRVDARRRPAVPGIVDNHLHNLLRRQPHIEGVAQMPAQLVFPLQHNQAGQGNHLPLYRRQRRPMPDRPEQRLAQDAFQVRRHFPGAGRRTAPNHAAAEHPARLLPALVAGLQFAHNIASSDRSVAMKENDRCRQRRVRPYAGPGNRPISTCKSDA